MHATIVHGTGGSPQGNWFPWLALELNGLGIPTTVPQMPTPDRQSLSGWLDAFREQCPLLTRESILIGHSCGAVLCMRLLERIDTPVKALVLVAPPYKAIGRADIDSLNASFLEDPFDWAKIRANAGHLFYLMGDNDQYVPQEQLLAIAEGLGTEPIIIPGGGHLNAETGYIKFPLLLNLLKVVFENEPERLP